MTDIVEARYNTLAFAVRAHGDQRRKYTNDPYMTHPITVARLTALAEDVTCQMIDAALLHDVVEDTDRTVDDIVDEFGYDTGEFVYWLTDNLGPEHGNRAWRKQQYAHRLGQAPNEVKTIKLADMIDNTNSICLHDSKFAPTYLAEKRFMLGFLKGGDTHLMTLAVRTLDAWSTYYGVK